MPLIPCCSTMDKSVRLTQIEASEESTTPGKGWPILSTEANPSRLSFDPLSLLQQEQHYIIHWSILYRSQHYTL